MQRIERIVHGRLSLCIHVSTCEYMRVYSTLYTHVGIPKHDYKDGIVQCTATHCNTLQHTATHCNALPHTATHSNTLQHIIVYTDMCALYSMGCLRLGGSLKSYVSFAGYNIVYRALLQKSPIKETISVCSRCKYGVATMCRLLKITGLFCRISSLL